MDTENIILKNIIEDKSYFNRVKSILNPKIFTENSSSEIYKIITDFYEKYQNIPTLQEIALKAQDLPIREVRSNIATKLREISLQENINKDFLDDLSVKFVKDQMFTQALMFGSEFIDKKDENAKQKAKDLIEKAQLISINDDLGSDYNNIDERIDYYQNPKKGIKFQRFESLNKYIGDGFLKGTLNVFLAPAGVGKSLLMSTTIGDFLCQGLNILLISMEMSNFEFMKRIDADLLDIEINSLKNVDPTIIKNKFEENKSKFGKLYVQNYPAGTFSANTLASLLEMYKANNIIFDAVYLDYLGLMASDKVSANAGLYSFIKSIGEEVRAVACQYQIPIFTASQLGRCFSLSKNKIKTKKGYKYFNELNYDDEIISQNGDIVRLVEKLETGKQKCFKVKLKSGKCIFISENHRMPTNEGVKSIKNGLKKGLKVNSV